MDSGFCGNRVTNIDQMTPRSADTQVRAEIMSMIERCPSGCYTYSIPPEQKDNEPDLPQQIAVVTEITSEGKVDGPLWVTGGIPIERCVTVDIAKIIKAVGHYQPINDINSRF